MSSISQQAAINGLIANSSLFKTDSISKILPNDSSESNSFTVPDILDISDEGYAAWENYIQSLQASESGTTDSSNTNSQDAFKSKLNDVISSLVSDGTLTQDQADEVGSALSSMIDQMNSTTSTSQTDEQTSVNTIEYLSKLTQQGAITAEQAEEITATVDEASEYDDSEYSDSNTVSQSKADDETASASSSSANSANSTESVLESVLSTLVQSSTITQDQADTISGLYSKSSIV